MSDLLWIRQNGLEAGIQKAALEGLPYFRHLRRLPDAGTASAGSGRLEHGGELAGLGLLPVTTNIWQKGSIAPEWGEPRGTNRGASIRGMSGVSAEGYEIHMGETCLLETLRTFCQRDGLRYRKTVSGRLCQRERMRHVYSWNTGRPRFAEGPSESCFSGKGMTPGTYRDLAGYRQEQYDILADVIRAHMDMDAVRRIIGLK